MQMTLETLGQLERRLHVAVPKAQIEGEIQKRLAQLAKTAKVPGFRPGKVPLEDGRAAIRAASALGSDFGHGADEPQRRDAHAESARSRLSAHRAETGCDRGPVRVLGRVRGLSGDQGRRSVVGDDHPAGGRGHAGRGREHDRDPAQAARALRAGDAPDADRRPRHRRLHRYHRRGGVCRRPGARFSDRAGRRQDAAGVRCGPRGHGAGRDQALYADLSGRLPRQGRGRQEPPRSRSQSSRWASRSCPPWTKISRAISASPAAAWTSCAAKSRPTWGSSCSARSRACSRTR